MTNRLCVNAGKEIEKLQKMSSAQRITELRKYMIFNCEVTNPVTGDSCMLETCPFGVSLGECKGDEKTLWWAVEYAHRGKDYLSNTFYM